MNNNLDSSNWALTLFLIVLVLVGIGVLTPILAYEFVRKHKRRRQEEEYYLLSRDHAKTIAVRISCRRHSWMDTEDGKAYMDGPVEAQFPHGHLFCESMRFRKEGITASVAMKDRRYLVGIKYQRDREGFAKEVAQILRSEHRMHSVLKPK